MRLEGWAKPGGRAGVVLQGGIRFCVGHCGVSQWWNRGMHSGVIPLFPSSTKSTFPLRAKTVGDLLSLNTIYVHIHKFPSQENVAVLGTTCLGLSAGVLWCRFGCTLRKAAFLAPGLGVSTGSLAGNPQQEQPPLVS